MSTPDANGWMPIKSAPIDGTHILLAGKHRNHGWVQKTCTFFAGTWWSNGQWVSPDMSHWQPLPGAPVA